MIIFITILWTLNFELSGTRYGSKTLRAISWAPLGCQEWPNCAGQRRSEIGSCGTSLAVHIVSVAAGRRSAGRSATDLQDVQKSRNLARIQPVAQQQTNPNNPKLDWWTSRMIHCVDVAACPFGMPGWEHHLQMSLTSFFSPMAFIYGNFYLGHTPTASEGNINCSVHMYCVRLVHGNSKCN